MWDSPSFILKIIKSCTCGHINDDKEGVKISTYKSGGGMMFHFGTIFINKEVIRDAIKGYEMEKKCDILKKNDS